MSRNCNYLMAEQYLLLMSVPSAIPFTILDIKPLFAAIIYAADFSFDVVHVRHRMRGAVSAASCYDVRTSRVYNGG